MGDSIIASFGADLTNLQKSMPEAEKIVASSAAKMKRSMDSVRPSISLREISGAFAAAEKTAMSSEARITAAHKQQLAQRLAAENNWLIALDRMRAARKPSAAEEKDEHGGGHGKTQNLRVVGDVIDNLTDSTGWVRNIQMLTHGPAGIAAVVGLGIAELALKMHESSKAAKELVRDINAINTQPADAKSVDQILSQLDAAKSKAKEVGGQFDNRYISRLWDLAEGVGKIAPSLGGMSGVVGSLGAKFASDYHNKTVSNLSSAAFTAKDTQLDLLDQLAKKEQSVADIEKMRVESGGKIAELAKLEADYKERVGQLEAKTLGMDGEHVRKIKEAMAQQNEQQKAAIERMHDDAARSAGRSSDDSDYQNEAQQKAWTDRIEGMRRTQDMLQKHVDDAQEDLNRTVSETSDPETVAKAQGRLSQAKGARDAGQHGIDEAVKDQAHLLDLTQKTTSATEAELGHNQDLADSLKLQAELESKIYELRKAPDAASHKQADDLERLKPAMMARLAEQQELAHRAQRFSAAGSVIDASEGRGEAAHIEATQQRLDLARNRLADLKESGHGTDADEEAYEKQAATVNQLQNSLVDLNEKRADALAAATGENAVLSLQVGGQTQIAQAAALELSYRQQIVVALRNGDAALAGQLQKTLSIKLLEEQAAAKRQTPAERAAAARNGRAQFRAEESAYKQALSRIGTDAERPDDADIVAGGDPRKRRAKAIAERKAALQKRKEERKHPQKEVAPTPKPIDPETARQFRKAIAEKTRHLVWGPDAKNPFAVPDGQAVANAMAQPLNQASFDGGVTKIVNAIVNQLIPAVQTLDTSAHYL